MGECQIDCTDKSGCKSTGKLSLLQESELEIFKQFVRICEERGFRYYVCGGTFLGAVRHKGFIPWDDDIDVAMPRPDFERFLEIAPDVLTDDLYLSTYKRGAEHITLVAMIISKDRKFTLNNASKKIRTGAWIDILVIDGAPKKGVKRGVFSVKYMYYRMLSQLSHFDEIVNLNKKRPWYENVIIRFAQLTRIEKHLDPVKIGDRFHTLLKKNNFENSEDVATFMGAAKLHEILPRQCYGAGTDYEYEGMKIKGPDMADLYLSHFYGDYMTPPDEEERNKHNVCQTQQA